MPELLGIKLLVLPENTAPVPLLLLPLVTQGMDVKLLPELLI